MQATQAETVNGTILRRFLTLTAVKLCGRWGPRSGRVLFLSPKICVKYGYFQDVSEAVTMQFIAQKTIIPVPRVYCAFRHKEVTYIVMERLEGNYVGQGWVRRSKESKQIIFDQLIHMIKQMRDLAPPEHVGVANVNGDSLFDGRLPAALDRLRFGPFKSVVAFHDYLRRGIMEGPSPYPEVGELIAMHQREWPLRFTHGDLSSLNILANGDKVTGIVDWETAGWYPSYWEYTSAWYVNPQNEFWREEVDKFIKPMPEALAMDQLRLKYFGEFT